METKKVAVVTGGSKGIGRAISLQLASDGYDVAIMYASSDKEAKEVKEAIEGYGRKGYVYQVDVSRFLEVQKVFAKIYEILGQIDVLVNNAGITKDQLFLRMEESDFDHVLDVNLKGTFNCTKAVSKPMLQQKQGSIINISSVIGKTGNIGQANYSASKAGIIGLTKSLAKEFARKNVRVNAIAPGFIETPMTEILTEKTKADILATIPAKCFGKPEDVANLVSFLATEKSKYITGQVIAIDGGMTY